MNNQRYHKKDSCVADLDFISVVHWVMSELISVM